MLQSHRALRIRAGAAAIVLIVFGGVGFALVAQATPGVVVSLPVGGGDKVDCAQTANFVNLGPTARGDQGLASGAVFLGNQANTIAVADPTNSDILYVSDVEWVRKVTLSTDHIETIAGTVHDPETIAGNTADDVDDARTAFVRVRGMTIDGNGVLYLVEGTSDDDNTRVRTLTQTAQSRWRLHTIARDPANALDPEGITVTAAGGIYVAQPSTAATNAIGEILGEGRLAKVEGQVLVSVISSGIDRPRSVTSDRAGHLYVAGHGPVYEVSGGSLAVVGGDYSASTGGKRIAVNPEGTRLFVADTSRGTLDQINVDENRNARKALGSKIYATSLWSWTDKRVLVGRSCQLSEAGPLENTTTSVGEESIPSLTTVPPTTVPSSGTDTGSGSGVQDVGTPVAANQPDPSSLFGRAPIGDAGLAPPPVSAGEVLGTGSGSGSATGSATVLSPPPPPPVVSPLPTPFLSPSFSPMPHGALAADPSPGAMAAPRHAIVRSESGTSGPGAGVIGFGAVVLVGCVACCAAAIGLDRGRGQRAPARSVHAWARAW